MGLHRTLLTAHGESLSGIETSPVTTAYLDHLHRCCATGSYAEAAAAVLPCFWLYQHIGERLGVLQAQRSSADAHPYAAWIETYADPAFAAATTVTPASRSGVSTTAASGVTVVSSTGLTIGAEAPTPRVSTSGVRMAIPVNPRVLGAESATVRISRSAPCRAAARAEAPPLTTQPS